MKIPHKFLLLLLTASHVVGSMHEDPRRAQVAVHQATGIKIGEVTSDSVIIWTRVTKFAEQNFVGPDFIGQEVLNPPAESQLIPGVPLDDMRGAVSGAPGEVRLTIEAESDPTDVRTTAWLPVDPVRDYTRQTVVRGLRSDVRYRLSVESRSPDGRQGERVNGGFKTAPLPASVASVRFAVVTCHDDWRREHAQWVQIVCPPA